MFFVLSFVSYFVLFRPTQPAACLNLAPSTREKQASTKYTGASRKKLFLPFWTTTLSRNPSAPLTTAVQSRGITMTICHHRNDIAVTGSRSHAAAQMSPFPRGGTATTLLLPHSRTGPVKIISDRITERRKTTPGTEIPLKYLYFLLERNSMNQSSRPFTHLVLQVESSFGTSPSKEVPLCWTIWLT